MRIQGEKVALRPMTVEEMPLFFEWATQSDGSAYWYGEMYGDRIPTREKFFQDWKRHYFDGTEPEKGRCFVILVDERPIGQVNYNEIDPDDRSTELDIIIADDTDKSKGYGSDAVRTLARHLFENMGVRRCWIEAAEENPRAIKAYEKAGFRRVESRVVDGQKAIALELRNW